MTYDNKQSCEAFRAATEWLYTQLPVFQHTGASAYKPGLDAARRLASMFGDPHRRLRTIHVAGTNGKGSTSSMLAAILTASGLRTGLYTSPHLVDFRERIRIDGRMIGRDRVVDFVGRYRRQSAGIDIEPSFFELTTIMAFEYFAEQQVDVAVIEVGLGGRLDTTNIIMPDLSIITNISLDHTALLGDTVEAIATEKAGIIKPGVPVVVGEADGAVRGVFDRRAAEAGAPIVYAADHAPIDDATDTGDEFIYHTRSHGELRSLLRGEWQPLNTACVLTAVDQLNSRCGYKIGDEALRRGLGQVADLSGLAGRWMRLQNNPAVICDTGHNIGGWEHIVGELNRIPGHKVLVLGFVSDKDISHILGRVAAVVDAEVIFTRASVARALDGHLLAEAGARAGLSPVVVSVVEPVGEAVDEAIRRARHSGATVFVGGSNFVVGDLLSRQSECNKL